MKKLLFIILPLTLFANIPYSSVNKFEDNVNINELITFFEISVNDKYNQKNFGFIVDVGVTYIQLGFNYKF